MTRTRPLGNTMSYEECDTPHCGEECREICPVPISRREHPVCCGLPECPAENGGECNFPEDGEFDAACPCETPWTSPRVLETES